MAANLIEVIYKGRRGTKRIKGSFLVTKETDGIVDSLNSRSDLHDHSSDGFSWGYPGSGPAQLAIAILSDALPSDIVTPSTGLYPTERKTGQPPKFTDHDLLVLMLYHRFTYEVISRLNEWSWDMPRSQVLNWVDLDLREEFSTSLKKLSKTCAAVVQPKEKQIIFPLKSLPHAQLCCINCQRVWDYDEDLTTGDPCPSCSEIDWYALSNGLPTTMPDGTFLPGHEDTETGD